MAWLLLIYGPEISELFPDVRLDHAVNSSPVSNVPSDYWPGQYRPGIFNDLRHQAIEFSHGKTYAGALITAIWRMRNNAISSARSPSLKLLCMINAFLAGYNDVRFHRVPY